MPLRGISNFPSGEVGIKKPFVLLAQNNYVESATFGLKKNPGNEV